MGLSIHHHFEFDYILNLYVLSMCFICYCSWMVCNVCNAVPILFFRLRNFLMRISAFPLCPRYIRCSIVITPDPDMVEVDNSKQFVCC
jgi:hypothetical protein